MNADTKTAALCAAAELDDFARCAARDTEAILQQNDIPSTVTYFAALRDAVNDLAAKVSELQKQIDSLSYETIPTLFDNQNVKTITLPDVGRVTVNVRWNATMLNKERGMEWLRANDAEGLIIETVNSRTLSSFAKAETLAGRSLPNDVFKISTSPYVSITPV